MGKFVFSSDKLVNGSLKFEKGKVYEIEKKDEARWIKRGAMGVDHLSVGKSVLVDGEMPNYEDLMKIEEKPKKKKFKKSSEQVIKKDEDQKDIEDIGKIVKNKDSKDEK